MKLQLKNNTYTVDNKAYTNVTLIDQWILDNPNEKILQICFSAKQKVQMEEPITDENGNLVLKSVEKQRTIGKTTVLFDKTNIPTYVTIGQETKDLLKYLKAGGTLRGSESIEIGYPSYDNVKKFFLKADIGVSIEINPKLNSMEKMLFKKFVLEKIIINGEPVGEQFRF